MVGLRQTLADMVSLKRQAGSGELQKFAYAPAGLPPGRPLVVVLHGCSQNAEDYARGAGWIALADRFGFAVLAPGQSRLNNPNACFNWFKPSEIRRGAGEAAAISDMIETEIASRYVDPKRVFITGLSAGGAMAAAVLATYPELFAGGAIIAGLPFGSASSAADAFRVMALPGDTPAQSLGDRIRSASSHAGAWPTISLWHGSSDRTVHPAASHQAALQWANVHGLNGEGVEDRTSSGRPFRAWRSGGRNVVELHTIAGMGHGTPIDPSGRDGCGTTGPFLLNVGISSSLDMARTWGIAVTQPNASALPDVVIHDPEIITEVSEPRAASNVPQLHKPSLDVGEVINRALRSAGLLK